MWDYDRTGPSWDISQYNVINIYIIIIMLLPVRYMQLVCEMISKEGLK